MASWILKEGSEKRNDGKRKLIIIHDHFQFYFVQCTLVHCTAVAPIRSILPPKNLLFPQATFDISGAGAVSKLNQFPRGQ